MAKSQADGIGPQNDVLTTDVSHPLRSHQRPFEREARAAPAELEPEFCGDAVVNNTSLVVWVEIRIDGVLRSVLLCGGLVNWTYLLARSPFGLQSDLLKASPMAAVFASKSASRMTP